MPESGAPRKILREEKEVLELSTLDMVNRALAMFDMAVRALYTLDKDLAHAAIQRDDEIDRLDMEIEEHCLELLALQQPMGTDLREIGTILKMITDIERVGDLSVDIAKTVLKIDKEMGRSDYIDLPKMAAVVSRMITEATQGFFRKDASHFGEVARLEDESDRLYREFRSQVHEYMVANPDQVVAASWMLLAVHHMERVGDHALNMAERVNFMVTGEVRQIDRDKSEP